MINELYLYKLQVCDHKVRDAHQHQTLIKKLGLEK